MIWLIPTLMACAEPPEALPSRVQTCLLYTSDAADE